MELPDTFAANGDFYRFLTFTLLWVILLVLLIRLYWSNRRYMRKYEALRESSNALRDHLSEVEELCRAMTRLGKISYFIGSAERPSFASGSTILNQEYCCGIEVNKMIPGDRERYQAQCHALFSGQIADFNENVLVQTAEGQRHFLIFAQTFVLPDSEHRKFLFAVMDVTLSEQKTQELADADSILKAIFENLPGHIFIRNISDDFSYVRCSPSYSQLIQKNPSDLVGKNDFDLFDHDLAQAIRAVDMKIANTGNTADNRWFFTTPDGKEHITRFISRKLVRADNSEWILGFGVDITRQEQLAIKLRRRNKELRLLLNQSRQAAFLLDSHLTLSCSTPLMQQHILDCQLAKEASSLCCADFCQCGITDPERCPAHTALANNQEQICRFTRYAGKQLTIKPLLNDKGTVSYLAVQLDDAIEENN